MGAVLGLCPGEQPLVPGFQWKLMEKQLGSPFSSFSGLGWHFMVFPKDIPSWHRAVGDSCHGAGAATPNPHSPWGALVYVRHWNSQTQWVQGKVRAVQVLARQERLHLAPKSSMVPVTFCHSLNLSPCPVAMGFPALFLAPVSLAPCWGVAASHGAGSSCGFTVSGFLYTYCGAHPDPYGAATLSLHPAALQQRHILQIQIMEGASPLAPAIIHVHCLQETRAGQLHMARAVHG